MNNNQSNVLGRNGINFNNQNDLNVYARINYQNYNRYGTYGNYNNWYRGPNNNRYGWYGGFLGLILGMVYVAVTVTPVMVTPATAGIWLGL